MDMTMIRPRSIWYGIAGLILILSIVLFVFSLIGGLTEFKSDTNRIVVPSKNGVVLPEAGKYTIFYEYNSVLNGKSFATGATFPALHCELKNSSTGETIPITAPTKSASYNLEGREGVGVLEFDIAQAGTFEFVVQYEGGQQGPEIVLGVGKNYDRTLLGISIAAGLFPFALVLIFIIYMRRRSYIVHLKAMDLMDRCRNVRTTA